MRVPYTAGAMLLIVLLAACGGYDDERDYGPTGPVYTDPPPDMESTSSGEGDWNY
ncbi:MAG TPA: hypothetical protein VEY33_01140 [Gemmatimonadota bacterium]|nr:hypothetical protein [Gemmatimonadota bacterium]